MPGNNDGQKKRRLRYNLELAYCLDMLTKCIQERKEGRARNSLPQGVLQSRVQRNECQQKSVKGRLIVSAWEDALRLLVTLVRGSPSGSSFNLAVQRPCCFQFMSIWGQESSNR